MASRWELQQDDIRLLVTRLITQNPEVSFWQVADEVGISNESAYYTFTALIEKGFVKPENFKNNWHKGECAHVLYPKSVREDSLLAHRFIVRKRREFGDLKAEIAVLEEEIRLVQEAAPSPQGKEGG